MLPTALATLFIRFLSLAKAIISIGNFKLSFEMKEATSGSEKLFREKLVCGSQENKFNRKGGHSSLKESVGFVGHCRTGPHTSCLYSESAVILNVMVSWEIACTEST